MNTGKPKINRIYDSDWCVPDEQRQTGEKDLIINWVGAIEADERQVLLLRHGDKAAVIQTYLVLIFKEGLINSHFLSIARSKATKQSQSA